MLSVPAYCKKQFLEHSCIYFPEPVSTATCLPTESQGRQARAMACFHSVNSPTWLVTWHQRKVTESEVRKKFTQIVLV